MEWSGEGGEKDPLKYISMATVWEGASTANTGFRGRIIQQHGGANVLRPSNDENRGVPSNSLAARCADLDGLCG